MGKWKGSRGRKKKQQEKGGGEGATGDAWFNLSAPKKWVTEKTNAYYEDYYRKVLRFDRPGLSEEAIEQDWRLLMEAMRQDLPTTFRVTASSPFAPLMTTKLAQSFKPEMAEAAAATGDQRFAFERIPWCVPLSPGFIKKNKKSKCPTQGEPRRYPDGLAWQLSAGRQEVRKSPSFARFRRFLIAQTENVRCCPRCGGGGGGGGGLCLFSTSLPRAGPCVAAGSSEHDPSPVS